MKIELVILIRLGDEEHRRLLEAGHLSLDQALNRQGFLERRVPARSDEARELLDQLEESSAEYYVREERHFSLKEIRAAEALHVEPQLAVGRTPHDGRTEYDWTECCTRCMRVPIQTGRLTVSGNDIAGRATARGPRGELLVNEHIAVRMIKEGVTGCILREVCTDEFGELPAGESFYQVVPTCVLPETVSPPTRFQVSNDQCQACGRGGLYLDSMLYYDFSIDELQDVNITSEYFGEGAGIAPEVVVSPRFYNLLVSSGAELAEPEPVMFV